MRLTMNRFNGWQRLWISLVVIWAITASIIGYELAPKKSDIYSKSAYEIKHFIFDNDVYLGLPEGEKLKVIEKLNLESEDNEKIVLSFLAKFHPDKSDNPETKKLKEIKLEFDQRMQDLPHKQLEACLQTALGIILPSIVIYVLGLMIAWIIKGFRGNTK